MTFLELTADQRTGCIFYQSSGTAPGNPVKCAWLGLGFQAIRVQVDPGLNENTWTDDLAAEHADLRHVRSETNHV